MKITDILTRAKRRGFEKCAICMSKNCSSYVNSSTTASFFIQNHHSSDCLIDPNNGNKECNGQRQLLILSCSHIFHFQCIQNFENFLADNQVSQVSMCLQIILIYLSIYLSMRPSIFLFFFLSFYLSIYLSINVSLFLDFFLTSTISPQSS